MNQNGADRSIERGQNVDAHDEFLELCALSASGSLTEEEQGRLDSHLQVCPPCSDTLKDFSRITEVVLPTLGPDLLSELDSAPLLGSTDLVKRRLLEHAQIESPVALSPASVTFHDRAAKVFADWHVSEWFAFWQSDPRLRYAVVLVLMVGLTVLAYRLGERRAAVASGWVHQSHEINDQSLQQQVGALTRETVTLTTELRERDYRIKNLSDRNILQSDDIAKFKENETDLKVTLHEVQAKNNQIASERDDIEHQLKSAQGNLDQANEQLRLAQAQFTRTQEELNHVRQGRDGDLLRLTTLETRISELSERLKGRDDTIAQQRELLDSDRDIRELMGARDLYLAEVYDTQSNGENEKPFGRVFFTKNRSLIFYAYDLDQQPGVQNASTFQAWGRRNEDRKHAVSLGIFYMDSAANKRWVLKVDDPQTLQQIDSVFVTVEPKGGSREPSRNKLLSAWLRVPPNHP